MNILRTEPALVIGVIVATANLLVGLGILSDTEGQNVAALAESLVILLAAVLVRSKVSPA